jgi:hypothetical protein
MTINYSLIESEDAFHNEHWTIRLEEGKYSGVEFQYDTVSVDESQDTPVLSFNWITLKNETEYDLTEEEFGNIIGDILVEMITEHLDSLDEDGTTDTQTSSE